MNALLYQGAFLGGLVGSGMGFIHSNEHRMRNALIGSVVGSAMVVALLAISVLNPKIGLFCRFATYGAILGNFLGHRILRADFLNSIRVGVIFGVFTAAMTLLFGSCGFFLAFFGLNAATFAYFSDVFQDTFIQKSVDQFFIFSSPNSSALNQNRR